MSYNLKCCSFYPNNFDASALPNSLHQKIQVITLLYIFASSFIEDKEYRKQRTIKQQEIWN